jgi:hypothetical protein
MNKIKRILFGMDIYPGNLVWIILGLSTIFCFTILIFKN